MAKVIVCMKAESYSDEYRYPIRIKDEDISTSDRIVQDNFSWEDTFVMMANDAFIDSHDIDVSPYSIHMIHVETGKTYDLSHKW